MNVAVDLSGVLPVATPVDQLACEVFSSSWSPLYHFSSYDIIFGTVWHNVRYRYDTHLGTKLLVSPLERIAPIDVNCTLSAV